MLIESVPGEQDSLQVLPFDDPREQYTLQVNTFVRIRVDQSDLKKIVSVLPPIVTIGCRSCLLADSPVFSVQSAFTQNA